MSENCIFCQIVNDRLESRTVYEDELTLAFLDVNPLAPGHTVVIPKAHIERLEDLPTEQMGPLFEAVRRVTDKVQQAMKVDATTIGINNGRAAGQAVPHLHVHIIPRRADDGGGSLHSIVHS
ncbi:MAG TPA: HIT family protein, partial [Candidatus Fraserbacteria bacterium]|nr:HIT family protein [Candidatus Fraserbacteria bacterium]